MASLHPAGLQKRLWEVVGTLASLMRVIELVRLALLLALAATAVTFLGSAAAWWWDEQRRLRRLVRRVLGGPPDGVIVALGRNAAAGFRLAANQVVVMRDGGADALMYRLHALLGAELIVDDVVVARVMRDEPRRTLDQVAAGARQVTLRLLFDDARHPDFSLDLWIPRDEFRRDARTPSVAIREARGWLARAEAILRRAAPPPERTAEPEPMPEIDPEPDFDREEEEADAAADEPISDPSEPPRLL